MLVVRYFVSILVMKSSWWGRDISLQKMLSLSSWCLVIVVLLLGLSAVCDCGISWSYSLFFSRLKLNHSENKGFHASWPFLVLQQRQNLGRRFGASQVHLGLRWLGLLFVLGRQFCLIDFLFIVTPIVGVCNCSVFCCTLLYVHTSFAIILMGMRELVALLSLSSWCLVMVVWLFLAVPWVCLRFVIVVFPDHTHLLFFQ